MVELRATVPIPADQVWYWSKSWQDREREVDEHVAAGRVTVHEDADAFSAHLDALTT